MSKINMIEPATGPRPMVPSEGSGIEMQESIKSLTAVSEDARNGAADRQQPKKAPLKKKSSVVVSKMNQYAQFDKNHPLAQPFPAIEGFKGPKLERKVTNIFALIIPVIVGAAFGFHVVLCHLNGWPTILTKPQDFRAQLCGLGRLADKPYLYFLTPSIDLKVAMCVSECPATTGSPIALYDVDGKTATAFTYTQIQTDRIGKFCYPVEPTPRKLVEEYLTTPLKYAKRVVGEMFLTFDVVALGLVIANALSFGVLFGLRKKSAIKLTVWGCISLSVFALEIFGYFCYQKYTEIISIKCLFGENRHNCGGSSSVVYLILAFVFWGLGVLYLALMAFFFNQVNLVIGIMGSALMFTGKASEIKSVPLVSGAIISGLCLLFLWVSFEAASFGTITKATAKNIDSKKVKTFVFNDIFTQLIPADFLLAYYLITFFISFIESVTSYAMCIWFFSKKKDTTKLDLDRCYKHTLKYHLGTIAWLAFLKMVFRPIRLISRPIYESLASGNQKNIFIRFFQVVCVPCIWLQHTLMRFLSKSALIQMNMWSEGYGNSSKKSYFLISVRHGDRGEGNDKLIEFVLRQIQTSVSLVAALVFYLYVLLIPYSPSFKQISDVADPLVGAALVFSFGILVSSSYTSTYDMILKAIVQCNFMDEEMFVGEQKYTEPIFDELMAYWKKADDDDDMNAHAEREKKKDRVKKGIDFDEHYKKIPEDGEESDRAPPSDDEELGAGDMYAEQRKGKIIKDQDFDEDFLKPKIANGIANMLGGIRAPDQKQLAKPVEEADPGMNAAVEFEVEEEPQELEADKQKRLDAGLKGLLGENSDESLHVDNEPKPTILFNVQQSEAGELSKKDPKPILKTSRAIDDDKVSMKSSTSKLSKKKVGITDKTKGAETKTREVIFTSGQKETEQSSSRPLNGALPVSFLTLPEDDDAKSSKSKKKKLEVQFRTEGQKEPSSQSRSQNDTQRTDLPSRQVATERAEADNQSMKTSTKLNLKPSALVPSFRAEDNNDNMSAKVSKKSGLKVKLPERPTKPKVEIVEQEDDFFAAAKPKAPTAGFGNKSAFTNRSAAPKFEAAPDQDTLAPKSYLAQPRTAPNQPQKDLRAAPGTQDNRMSHSQAQNGAPKGKNDAPNTKRGLNRDEFEEDFMRGMENVVDKNQDIRILNASQGASMLSIKNSSAISKNNNSKANASAVKFQFRDESDQDDDNFF